ncbi:hypothetical protein TcCL_ESM09372 [Trypanosoma cruzi]|nr:hypothetical protein TcCL_ESM09372 [Trypanosoma cruzi]
MVRDDDCLCFPFFDGTRVTGRGLQSALGVERMVCAAPHCECGTTPVREERSKGQRRGLVCAPSLSLPPCVCRAHGSILQCDVDGVSDACVVRRASLPHGTVLLCGRVEGVEMCEGVRVTVVSAHLDLPHNWHLSAASRSSQAVD